MAVISVTLKGIKKIQYSGFHYITIYFISLAPAKAWWTLEDVILPQTQPSSSPNFSFCARCDIVIRLTHLWVYICGY